MHETLREEKINTLAEWMQNSKHTVVLTGAGMSTESGLPDFRSKSGWWKQMDPTTVATSEAVKHNYDVFQEFYAYRIEMLSSKAPHRGHELLAEWEGRGLVHLIATQNVDGFHKRAGNKRVEELHGQIHTVRCNRCRQPGEMADFLEKKPCSKCGDKLRPNVVLFGEMLPQDAWRAALNAIEKADLVIVIGTSLQVYPFNQLPTMTRGKVAIVNMEATDMDAMFHLVIHGKAGDTLQELENLLHA
jgi:NAD-dependent deacetylase